MALRAEVTTTFESKTAAKRANVVAKRLLTKKVNFRPNVCVQRAVSGSDMMLMVMLKVNQLCSLICPKLRACSGLDEGRDRRNQFKAHISYKSNLIEPPIRLCVCDMQWQ